MTTADSLHEQVREVLEQYGRLPGGADQVRTLGADDDLFRAGLTSHASVNVMLALEDAFDVEFPDELLHRATFETICAIAAALAALRESVATS